ncbi:LuxR family transcriptional regulator [Streptomyces sp. NBC_01465]|uniref:LuxR family transcriptional regulator n=1 Tax=Streptomyces sp. NBC_01465 TaxID=2903878 RepID=UPI002E38238C|nr:LuxR family transcriptional regulator [Streptomyces sp. NBC_01465]
METNSLGPLADALLAEARAGAHGRRSARTVYGGNGSALAQTMIALLSGSSLSDHENPGHATVLVVRGRVRLTAGEVLGEGTPFELLAVPEAVHGLEAVEDSVILLTVARQI